MNKLIICIFFAITFVMSNAMPADEERSFKIRGGVRKLVGDDFKEAKETLEFSLKKLSESKEKFHYKIGKIHSATKQVVSGSKYKINADLIDNTDKIKNCNITIWSQPWLDNGIEVTFEFEGEEPIVKKHSV